jgi:YggT family protein
MDLLVGLICTALSIAVWVVIIWIVLSYVVSFGRLPYDHPVRRFYDAMTRIIEPLMAPIRRVLPPLRLGGVALDLSPLVLIIGIQVADWLICRVLF